MSTRHLTPEAKAQTLALWAENPHLRPASLLVAEARTPELIGFPGVVFVTINQDGVFRVYTPEELPQALRGASWALTGEMRIFPSLKVSRPVKELDPLMVERLKRVMRKWGAGAALGVVEEVSVTDIFG